MTALQDQKLYVDLYLLFDYDRFMNFEFDGSRDFIRIRMNLLEKYMRSVKSRPRVVTRTLRSVLYEMIEVRETIISEFHMRSDLTANNATQIFFG